MSKLQNSKNQIFIDFIPAELRENSEWRIVYYVKNPFTDKLAIKRVRVKKITPTAERRKFAKKVVREINTRLEQGWNPFYNEKNVKEFTTLKQAAESFINRVEVEFKDNNIRFDTFKTYKSQISNLLKYLEETNNSNLLCYKFNSDFIGEYLDYVRYVKKLSARTRDNYLGFLVTFCKYLFRKKYITTNPTEHFTKINKKSKNRVIISDIEKSKILNYWTNKNTNYLLVCLLCYYCFIRRTELLKLKVKDVNLQKSTIFISADTSKSRNNKIVSVPKHLHKMLLEQIKEASQNDLLFSADKFKAGSKACHPDKITKWWATMRKNLKITTKIDWYSLKDTGITDLLEAGVPLISVRNQARHHSSNQTDAYTPLSMKKADENVINAKVKF